VALNVLGAVLLVAGFGAAWRAGRERPGTPTAAWHPDPSEYFPQSRWWDSRAWTARVRPADFAADRGRRFHGRFRGSWAWLVLGAVAVFAAGSVAYAATGSVHVMAAASFLAMTGAGWAFYRFTARQLALDDVIGWPAVIAVAVATAGVVLLVAAHANRAILDAGGVRTATAAVGFVEEGTKLLIPIGLFLIGRYRDPRAGIAIGLAAGFGFAITETTKYAYTTANASGPDLCGAAAGVPTVAEVIQAQAYRIVGVSPLHWLWTGIATAVAWRLWHLYGRHRTPATIGAILLVMVIHSANDMSATLDCDNAGVSGLGQLFRWAVLIAMYLVFKAMARKSTPPPLIGVVSKGWIPRRLRTTTH